MIETPPIEETIAIENSEGFRSVAYWDPIGQVWTAGYGQTGHGITQGTVVTRQEATQWLIEDEDALIVGLRDNMAWTLRLSAPRFGALVDAAYNLGLSGLLGFHEALTAMQAEDWIGTVRGFRASLWYQQVPHRVDAISYMVVFNEWLENYADADQLALLTRAMQNDG